MTKEERENLLKQALSPEELKYGEEYPDDMDSLSSECASYIMDRRSHPTIEDKKPTQTVTPVQRMESLKADTDPIGQLLVEIEELIEN